MSSAPAELLLLPHPSRPASPVSVLRATLAPRPDGGLVVRYYCKAPGGRVRLPEPRASAFVDGLWRHTCCELFIAKRGESAYREFNFSPCGSWAVYAFSAYRDRVPLVPEAAPTLNFAFGRDEWILTADLPAQLLPMLGELEIGLSAVIEDIDGGLEYRALAHPRPIPDFHDRHGFVLPWVASTVETTE